MKLKLCILFIVALTASCSSLKAEKQEVVIDDGYKTTGDGEVVLEDNDIKPITEAVDTTKKSSGDGEFLASDGSRIRVMTDSYGNKSEMRYFDNDSKLDMILVRTSVNGEKQVYVYGQNGEVKDLPLNMVDKALTSNASELATAAGIYNGKRESIVTKIFTPIIAAAVSEPVPGAVQATDQQENGQQNETIEEVPAKQAESTANPNGQVKTPLKLGLNLQNYAPKKELKTNDK